MQKFQIVTDRRQIGTNFIIQGFFVMKEERSNFGEMENLLLKSEFWIRN